MDRNQRSSQATAVDSCFALISLAYVSGETHNQQRVFRPGGIVPYIGYIKVCAAPKGVVFLAVLVCNRVSISTILVWNWVRFVHSSLELGVFFRRISYFFII